MENTFTRRYGLKVGAMLTALAAGGHLFSITEVAAQIIGEEAENPGTVGGELVIGITNMPDTLDPHFMGAAISSDILGSCGNALIVKGFDGAYYPALASAWTISEDGLTWDFTIRDGVTFHDGTPMTAESVKATFDRLMDPETAAGPAIGMIPAGATTELIDGNVFRFNLVEAFAPFLDNLTASHLMVINAEAATADPVSFATKPILTGAWYVDEVRTGDRVIIKRNPDYNWAPEFLHQEPAGAFIETITFRSIIEDASRVAAFEAGEIHQLGVPATDVARITENPDFNIVTHERQGMVLIEFNVTKPLFADANVRRALVQAVDRQDVLDAAIDGYGTVANGFLSPTIFGYWDGIADYQPGFDQDASRALLAEAGWADANGDGVLEKDGEDFVFTLLVPPGDPQSRGAQVVQSYLAEVGVKMEIQVLEQATLVGQAVAGEHDSEMIGYTYTDPDIAYIWFHSSQAGTGLNMSHIQDPELDKLIEAARAEVDRDARAELYAEIQRYVVDLALWIPLWSDSYYTAFQPQLKNAQWHPDAFAVYYDAFMEE